MSLALAAALLALAPAAPLAAPRRAVSGPLMAAGRAAELGPVRRHLRSVGVALATALVVAVPRGAARAAQEQLCQEATPVARSVDNEGRRCRQHAPAFLFSKKEVRPVYLAPPPPGSTIDLDKLLPKSAAERFTHRDFIFSDGLTAKSDLEEELEEIETYKESSKGLAAFRTLTTTGGAVGLIYLSYKGLTNVERWIKEQELRDIEEERELTGTYISVDASDVDSAIDPTTGKNMTISRGNKTAKADDGKDVAAKEAPWILRVLGLGDSVASDDEGFWEPAVARPPPSGKPKGGGAGGGENADGSTDSKGGDNQNDDGDDDDDSSGIPRGTPSLGSPSKPEHWTHQ